MSFKMKNLITSLEQSIRQENWYAALLTALTLPDIAGKIEYYPKYKKKTQLRYQKWFDEYIKHMYPAPDLVYYVMDFMALGVPSKTDSHKNFLTGTECYAIRCKFMHEGSYSVIDAEALYPLRKGNNQKEIEDRIVDAFQFIVDKNNPNSHMNIKWNFYNKILQIHVDVFCRDILRGVKKWMSDIEKDPKKQESIDKLLKIQVF